MKYIIIISLFSIFSIAQASDLLTTAVVLSALDTGSTVIHKDKYSEMISVIKEKIPTKGFYASVDAMDFDAPKEDLSYYVSYFKNDGYNNVSIKNGKIHFDFTGHPTMRKKFDALYAKQDKEMMIVFFSIIIGFVLIQLARFFIDNKTTAILKEINQKIVENAKKNNSKATIFASDYWTISQKISLIKAYIKSRHQ